ncbi:hypothetical protein C6V05_21450 [Burkholderia multivorans]|nr:hypothetical protein C6V05_21450 [Burkholderia multivorans]
MRLALGGASAAPAARRAGRVAGRPRWAAVRPFAPPAARACRRSRNDPIYLIPTASAHLTKLNHSEIDAVF